MSHSVDDKREAVERAISKVAGPSRSGPGIPGGGYGLTAADLVDPIPWPDVLAVVGDEEPLFAAVETHATWSNRGPTQPLTREAFEAGVQAMRDWKPPESWTDYCPACSARGYRRACEMCRGVGVVCVSRRPAGLPVEPEGWYLPPDTSPMPRLVDESELATVAREHMDEVAGGSFLRDDEEPPR